MAASDELPRGFAPVLGISYGVMAGATLTIPAVPNVSHVITSLAARYAIMAVNAPWAGSQDAAVIVAADGTTDFISTNFGLYIPAAPASPPYADSWQWNGSYACEAGNAFAFTVGAFSASLEGVLELQAYGYDI